MDQAVFDAIVAVLIDGGHSEDSSTDLAFHIAQHFPEHGLTLLQADAVDVHLSIPEQNDLTSQTPEE